MISVALSECTIEEHALAIKIKCIITKQDNKNISYIKNGFKKNTLLSMKLNNTV